jgi:CHAD domain-containing protein
MMLLNQRLAGLMKDLSKAVSKVKAEVTPRNVHRLRTTIRRIETAVSYAHPDVGKKLERTLKKLGELRKRAGKVRDIDVQITLLKQIANGSTAGDRKALAALLEKKRARQAKRLVSAVEQFDKAKFFARMEQVADEAEDGPSGRHASPFAPLEEARWQLTRMARDLSSRPTIKPNRLHQARIQIKKVRYLAELADESPEQESFVRELKTAQDAMGAWHDWEELARLAEKKFGDRSSCALLSEVRALYAARYSAALSALTMLVAGAVSPAGRKPPRATQVPRTMARPA